VLKSYNIGLCANVLCEQQHTAPVRTLQFAIVLSAEALGANVIINPLLHIIFYRFGISCPRVLSAVWLITHYTH
jgi:hypothetical protein